jgi:FKBP-type peptidyl-prolyl cis-trans isomerase FklB
MKLQGCNIALATALLLAGMSASAGMTRVQPAAAADAGAAEQGHDAHDGHDHDNEASVEVIDEGEVLSGFSYTMGYSLAQRVVADVPDLDLAQFTAGFEDAYVNNPSRLGDEQMQALVEQYNGLRMARAQKEFAELAQANQAAAAAFLAKNAKKRGVKTTASGLQYEVLKKGKGASPAASDIVTAHYHGTLPDGTVFDSSVDRGEPEKFALDRVIRGWTEGVQLMNKGAKFRFVIPPQLAYGERGAGEVIGPNQVLVFEVELVDFAPAAQPAPTGE